jgi:hypothetical protein
MTEPTYEQEMQAGSEAIVSVFQSKTGDEKPISYRVVQDDKIYVQGFFFGDERFARLHVAPGTVIACARAPRNVYDRFTEDVVNAVLSVAPGKRIFVYSDGFRVESR